MASESREGGARSRTALVVSDLVSRVRAGLGLMMRRGRQTNAPPSRASQWLGRAIALGVLGGASLALVSLVSPAWDASRTVVGVSLATLAVIVVGLFVGAIVEVDRGLEPAEPDATEPPELWDSWIDDQQESASLLPLVDTSPPLRRGSAIVASRAVVRPRVISTSGGSLPLEDEIWPLVKSGRRGAVRIWGGPGLGKTTALRHLAALLPAGAHVVLLDQPEARDVALALDRGLVIYTSKVSLHSKEIASFGLASWSDDEFIEYSLGVARERCASVMARLKSDIARFDQELAPELWRLVLDRMIGDDAIESVSQVLRLEVVSRLPNDEDRVRIGEVCLKAILAGATPVAAFSEAAVNRLIRHRPVSLLLAADRAVAKLASGPELDGLEFLSKPHPRELVDECGPVLACAPAAIECLKVVVRSRNPTRHAMAASLLHAARSIWRPEGGWMLSLSGAYLAEAQWPKVNLNSTNLRGVDFNRADLEEASLRKASINKGQLSQAVLRGANLDGIRGAGACFAGADLSYATARKANFRWASLARANLEGACLRQAWLVKSDLRGARLIGADLTLAFLEDAQIDDADFTNVEFERAVLNGLMLYRAKLDGARFQAARMDQCIMAGVDLRDADFTDSTLKGAIFTASKMPNANFLGADLRDAKLAEIHWPGACLRDADLREANFHMGTTRSGLVSSTVPCEGSRTGFYTDDFHDREHLPPEQIRKANLCGADLRGALIDDVDFYLVDLRGAHFSAQQASQFRRCGAILDDAG